MSFLTMLAVKLRLPANWPTIPFSRSLRLHKMTVNPSNPTILLWAGNAAACLLLVLIAAYQLYLAFFGAAADLPEITSLRPQPIHLIAAPDYIGMRNGFDTASTHWHADSISPAREELLGVIMLPGVRAAVTRNGAVSIEGVLAGGKLLQVFDNRVVVERATGTETIPLPLAHRPTLQSLNSAQPRQNSVIKESK